MSLASQQQAMLGLMRLPNAPTGERDPYLRRVARSRDLREARNNVFLWRAFVLARTAPLTYNLLKRCGRLKAELDRYIAGNNLSPYRETHAAIFLDGLGNDADELVACVAQFERALHRVRHGDAGPYVMRWAMDPLPILLQLAADSPDDISLSEKGAYQIVIARNLPGYFEVSRL